MARQERAGWDHKGPFPQSGVGAYTLFSGEGVAPLQLAQQLYWKDWGRGGGCVKIPQGLSHLRAAALHSNFPLVSCEVRLQV